MSNHDDRLSTGEGPRVTTVADSSPLVKELLPAERSSYSILHPTAGLHTTAPISSSLIIIRPSQCVCSSEHAETLLAPNTFVFPGVVVDQLPSSGWEWDDGNAVHNLPKTKDNTV